KEAVCRGSGILIGPDIVLTAASNIYDNQKPVRKRYPYLKFILGANNDKVTFGEIEIEDVCVPEGYINHEGERGGNNANSNNYALIILKKQIGREIGYFGMHALAADTTLIQTKEISVVGYPREIIKAESQEKFEQFEENGKIVALDSQQGLIHYSTDSS